MNTAPVRSRHGIADKCEARLTGMIEYLRAQVHREPDHFERFHVVFLDPTRRAVADQTMGQGSIGLLRVRMRELFARALSLEATGIIIAHNHPSGICRPSTTDIAETQRLAAVGQTLDIELVDHLIFTRKSVYSMRAGGDL